MRVTTQLITRHTILLCGGILLVGLSTGDSYAQNLVTWSGAAGNPGDYNVNSNWDTGFAPAFFFDEAANIENGGIAFLSEPASSDPAQILLGDGSDTSGTLEIRSGGSIATEDGETAAGLTLVGNDGQGTLLIHNGGTLSTQSLSSSASPAGSIVLGQVGGSGAATLDTPAATLGGVTTIIGPNVDFSAGSLVLQDTHQLDAVITGSSHSAISAGNAQLGGRLSVDLSGHSASLGDTFPLIDASSVTGSFANVVVDPPLGAGQGIIVNTVSGGANGNLVQAKVGVQLELLIDRGTGAAQIRNNTAMGQVDLDGYALFSSGEVFDANGWNSLAGSGEAGWTEANAAANHLTETNLSGTRNLGPNSAIDIGTPYAFAPTAIGELPEDVQFQYTQFGETVNGLVTLTGPQNNLVLRVDPDTGEAALQNQSPFDINLDSYAILSSSRSLDSAGWTSFAEGGEEGWTEANPSSGHLTEDNLQGDMFLAGDGSQRPLGNPFDFDGADVMRDLSLLFSLSTGEVLTGSVVYEPGPFPFMDGGGGMDGIPGDYNNNGQVEQGDLDLVLLNWGDVVDPAAINWTNDLPDGQIDQGELDGVLLNWGNSAATLNAGAVPEPASISMLLLAVLAAGAVRFRK